MCNISVLLTRMVLCRFELTLLNISLPTMVAMVGKTRAPHRILVADTWSARGVASAGIRGTGQPMPEEIRRGGTIRVTIFGFPSRNAKQISLRTWKDAVENLKFVGVLPPQAQDVVFPADHFAKDQHDGNCGQSDEQEERVRPLHHIQTLLVTHHLDGRWGRPKKLHN